MERQGKVLTDVENKVAYIDGFYNRALDWQDIHFLIGALQRAYTIITEKPDESPPVV